MLSRGAIQVYRMIQRFIARYKRPFFASQEWVAEKLDVSVRTVKRWFKELLAGNEPLIRQTRRARSTAFYNILRPILALHMSPQVSPLFKEEHTSYVVTPSESNAPRKPAGSERGCVQINRDDQGFESFMGVFVANGRPMNGGDVAAAKVLWCTLCLEDRIAARRDVERQLRETVEVRFMPLPQNYIRARPWTRSAIPRLIQPFTDEDRANADVLRIMEERAQRRKLA